MSAIGRTLEERPGWIILALLLLVIGMIFEANREDNVKCAQLMTMARSSRDSLDARIACEQIKSSTSQSIAIGAAAGAIAGSAASRR